MKTLAENEFHITTLIFADQDMIDFVLELQELTSFGRRVNSGTGRVEVLIATRARNLLEHGYFVDHAGKFHPMDLVTHVFPGTREGEASIYHVLVPRK